MAMNNHPSNRLSSGDVATVEQALSLMLAQYVAEQKNSGQSEGIDEMIAISLKLQAEYHAAMAKAAEDLFETWIASDDPEIEEIGIIFRDGDYSRLAI